MRINRVADDFVLPRRSRAVDEHAGDAALFRVMQKAQHGCRAVGRAARRVHDEHGGRFRQPGERPGRTAGFAADAVVIAHCAFDERYVARCFAHRQQRADIAPVHQEFVEVMRNMAACGAMLRRVEIIGAGLERRDGQAARGKRRHQRKRGRRFAAAAARAGEHQSHGEASSLRKSRFPAGKRRGTFTLRLL